MKKIIVFTTLCFFSLLLKNEKANCKSNCESSCKTAVKHSSFNIDANTNAGYNEPKQYDGFFFKI